jgi:hypothetical protein
MKYLFLITLLLSCKNGTRKLIQPHFAKDSTSKVSTKRDTSTVHVHDAYETGKDTVLLNATMDKIFKFPEVQELDKEINKSSKGTHGDSIIVRDEFEGDSAYYDFMVGDNSHEDRYVTIFNFVMEKRTGKIKAFDSTRDSIMTLKDLRKTRE